MGSATDQHSARSGAPDYTLIDHAAGPTEQGYQLRNTYRTRGGHTVRVEIRRDSYEIQSYARARVLTTDLTWTTVVEENTDSWHSRTDYRVTGRTASDRAQHVVDLLGDLADGLIARAATIVS